MRRFDGSSSLLLVHTKASGLLAAAAFDVTVASRALRIAAQVDAAAPEQSMAEVLLDTGSFEAHALHRHLGGQPVEVSASDARQIADKTRGKLREAFGPTIRVELTGGARSGAARLRFDARVAGRTSIPIEVQARLEDTRIEVQGRGRASLARLGVPKVKGPLGSLVVADEVELEFEAVLVAAE